jgi:Nucleotidyltransferase domain
MKAALHQISGLDNETNQWIHDAGILLAQVTGAKIVLLFGSLARGQGHSDSDADFCCVLPNGTDLRKASRAAQFTFLKRNKPMDFYLIEEANYLSGRTILAREIRRHAIVLYDHQTAG